MFKGLSHPKSEAAKKVIVRLCTKVGRRRKIAEWYLVSMAYNILKLHHKIQDGRLETHLVIPKTA